MNIREFKAALPEKKALIGFDYGSRRLGVAVSDLSRTIASSHTIILRQSMEKDTDAVRRIIEEKEIGGMVFGLPLQMDGTEGATAAEVRTFAGVLAKKFSLPVALFTGEYFKGRKIAAILGTVIDLLAGIPSIIYGLWGFYVLRGAFMYLDLSPQGSGILTASFVLAIMIVPYAASLSAEFIKMVPAELKEGAYAMGATRAEVIRRVIFPMAGSGIFSAFILAIGRALGETMTVTMLIGNTNQMPDTLRTTGNTMASIIANQFGEADGLKLSSLIAIGLLLFLITAVINIIGKILIRRARHV